MGFEESFLVLLRHFNQEFGIIQTCGDGTQGIKAVLEVRAFLQQFLGFALVIPELWLGTEVIKFCEAFRFRCGVKDTSGGPKDANASTRFLGSSLKD